LNIISLPGRWVSRISTVDFMWCLYYLQVPAKHSSSKVMRVAI
jgi:hypothetical protein